MNSKRIQRQRKEVLSELKTEYLYYILPFVLLILVKLTFNTWEEIVLSPEWSLASCLIFGQITSKVSKAISMSKYKTKTQAFGWYTAKRFFLVVVSTFLYISMLVKPSLILGASQIALFSLATYFHFKDGIATDYIKK